jgi:Cu+-exporting ATPase
MTAGVVEGIGHTKDEMLWLAGSVEQASEHPLARAIVQAAQESGVELAKAEGFRATPGGGAEGTINGERVLVGSARFLQEHGVREAQQNKSINLGYGLDGSHSSSFVLVAVNGQAIGVIVLADFVKESTPEALRQLREDGLELVMVTGDVRETADKVARELGIKKFEAGARPQEKAEIIGRLKADQKIVAMAGDGVNDAPALAAADVGIAMGTGTDVAIESAGITLVKGDLQGLVRARKLSRATIRNIKQNLWFAFLYNAIGIPIAAGVLYPWLGLLLSPMIASAAMSFSSVSVIGNALRLRNARI